MPRILLQKDRTLFVPFFLKEVTVAELIRLSTLTFAETFSGTEVRQKPVLCCYL